MAAPVAFPYTIPRRPSTRMRLDRRDRFWLVVLALSLAAGLSVSWQRWGSPLIDCGREMNQPLRLLEGQRLYADVANLYGPLAPYLNALLYRVFGVGLGTLIGHSLVVTLLIVALTYWIGRRILDPPGAALAALAVTWLCALKPSGNYLLPYSFGALDACLLGLVALTLSTRFIETRSRTALALAGVAAGLGCSAKIELGLAACAALALAAWIGGRSARERAWHLAVGLGPALLVVAAAYELLALSIGWPTLLRESYLLPSRLPAALVFFNKRMFGFDRPWESIARMTIVGLRLALAASAVAWAAAAASSAPGSAGHKTRARVLAGRLTITLVVLVAATSPFASWDMGPFLAVPLLLVGILAYGLMRARRGVRRTGRIPRRAGLILLLTGFALATLARSLLRVRSGGAYSSYLLPAALVLFAYSWVHLLPLLMPRAAARHAARRLALGLLLAWVLGAAVVTAYRYDKYFRYALRTPRGTMRVLPDLGLAFEQAMAFIRTHTRPGDAVAVMPEGTALDFFTNRRNPLNEEITTPGLLDEGRAIQELADTRTPLILVTNRPTVEFGAPVLGRDYHQRLMSWIREHYRECGLFGAGVAPDVEIGDPVFFIRAYCLQPEVGSSGR